MRDLPLPAIELRARNRDILVQLKGRLRETVPQVRPVDARVPQSAQIFVLSLHISVLSYSRAYGTQSVTTFLAIELRVTGIGCSGLENIYACLGIGTYNQKKFCRATRLLKQLHLYFQFCDYENTSALRFTSTKGPQPVRPSAASVWRRGTG